MTDKPAPPDANATGWQAYLPPDETILWQGQPASEISWRGGEMGTVLLGAIIFAFIGFGVWDSWVHSDGSDPFTFGRALGVMVFASIGVGVTVSGPLGMQMVRRGTWYTLTNRRAIIAHWPMVFGVTVYRGLDCYPVTDVAVVGSDMQGLKTVQFSRMSQRHTFVDGDGWRKTGSAHSLSSSSRRTYNLPVGFDRIADAAHVAELCRKVKADPRHMDWVTGR